MLEYYTPTHDLEQRRSAQLGLAAPRAPLEGRQDDQRGQRAGRRQYGPEAEVDPTIPPPGPPECTGLATFIAPLG